MSEARALGISGWSGSGKTVLLTRLIPLLVRRGLRVATLKHAHHLFDVDVPGKDSYEHRRAGACEVIVASARRWAQMHELGDAPEPSLAELLGRVSPCELVLIEGYKGERHPKLEVFRAALGKTPLHASDATILGIASDVALPGAGVPVVALDDIAAIEALVLKLAQPMSRVLAALGSAGT